MVIIMSIISPLAVAVTHIAVDTMFFTLGHNLVAHQEILNQGAKLLGYHKNKETLRIKVKKSIEKYVKLMKLYGLFNEFFSVVIVGQYLHATISICVRIILLLEVLDWKISIQTTNSFHYRPNLMQFGSLVSSLF